jgi:hypothetical protein
MGQGTSAGLELNTSQSLSTLSSHLTPITEQDIPLFRRFFSAERRLACYGNSWTYITQACRGLGLGYKFFDGQTLLALGMERGHFVVVRPLGKLGHSTAAFFKTLFKASNKPVYIKKLFADQVIELQSLATFQRSEDYPWGPQSFADDDTFPEMVIDLDVTLRHDLTGSKWFDYFRERQLLRNTIPRKRAIQYRKEFRRRVRYFQRSGKMCSLQKLHTKNKQDVWEFIQQYFTPNRKLNALAYRNMLQRSIEDADPNYYYYVAYVDNSVRPKGFFLLERLDGQSVGSYAKIVDRDQSGLSEYLTFQVLLQLRREGIRFVNTGGSERIGLHQFKKKYTPVEERSMTMLVYAADNATIKF